MLAHIVILVLVYHVKHHLRDPRVKLRAFVRFYLPAHRGLGKDRTIAPSRRHGIIGVRHGYYPRDLRDVLTRKAVGIALPVVSFMMPPRPGEDRRDRGDGGKHDISCDGMKLHQLKLFFCELPRLVYDIIRNMYLSHIMKKAGDIDRILLGFRLSKPS